MRTDFVDLLERRLQLPLPGDSAHQMMKPLMKNGSPIQFPPKDNTREGGVLILFHREEDNFFFPLIRRTEYKGVHSGQIALPGGKREDEDSDLIQTALREAEEEIGIESNKVKVLGHLSPFYVGASNFDILPVVGYLDQSPSYLPDPHEVSGIIKASTDHLTQDKFKNKKDITVRNGVVLSSPYFEVQNEVVWGATAMMLSELSIILKEILYA